MCSLQQQQRLRHPEATSSPRLRYFRFFEFELTSSLPFVALAEQANSRTACEGTSPTHENNISTSHNHKQYHHVSVLFSNMKLKHDAWHSSSLIVAEANWQHKVGPRGRVVQPYNHKK